MKIERVEIREIRLPLVHFFETSFGKTTLRQVILAEVYGEGISGWGECVAGEGPFYSSEAVFTAWPVLCDYLAPALSGRELSGATDLPPVFRKVRGHRMAKAALESALWDLEAKTLQIPLWKHLGGTRREIPCGVSVGIQDSLPQLLEKIEEEAQAGYRKIKLKIKPGWDVEMVRAVREKFPEIPLMVDANSAYTLEDAERLKELDSFRLMMIEQPLAHDDLFEHRRLQELIQTPICLDESIRHARDAQAAIELGSCRIVNIKMGRVGGLAEARRVHDLCAESRIPVWCGGMLETGIGRAHNIALSTLENFSIPGDVSASKRYYERDVIQPSVEVSESGAIVPPEEPGIGFQPDRPWIDRLTFRKAVF